LLKPHPNPHWTSDHHSRLKPDPFPYLLRDARALFPPTAQALSFLPSPKMGLPGCCHLSQPQLTAEASMYPLSSPQTPIFLQSLVSNCD
jgi:hypothetical protein